MATIQAQQLQGDTGTNRALRREPGSPWARAQSLRDLAERLRQESIASSASTSRGSSRADRSVAVGPSAAPATNADDLVHNRPGAAGSRQRAAALNISAGQAATKGSSSATALPHGGGRPIHGAARNAATPAKPAPGSSRNAMAQRDGGDDKRGRSLTIPATRLTRAEVAEGIALAEWMDYRRPANRGECVDGPRPCPYVSCKHHLYLDVNPLTGSIKVNFPDLEVWEMEESCALDIAERGGQTLEEVGAIMNLTRERIRQVEVSGLERLQAEDFAMDLEDAFTT